MYSIAIVADSRITLPRFPVMVRLPFPFESIDSINKISPPTLVQAKPVKIARQVLDEKKTEEQEGLDDIQSQRIYSVMYNMYCTKCNVHCV